MKSFYLVKTWAMATVNNPSFAGLDAFYYTGKGGHTLAARGSYTDRVRSGRIPRDYTSDDVRRYGYARLCDARRVMNMRKRDAARRAQNPEHLWTEMITLVCETVPD